MMMSPPPASAPDDAELACYLLGELSDSEEAALDVALAEPAVWEALQRAEEDLIDAYAAGRLDAARHQRLAERLAVSPRLRERLAVHRALRAVAARHRIRRLRRRALAVASGGLAIAAVVTLVVVFARHPGPRPTPPAAVAMLTLAPTTRGGELPVVHVAEAGELVVSVVIDPEEAFPHYHVAITLRGTVRWSHDLGGAEHGTLVVRVPGSAFGDGIYQLELTGIAPDGARVRLGARGFRVATERP